jgi:hypothetical protein
MTHLKLAVALNDRGRDSRAFQRIEPRRRRFVAKFGETSANIWEIHGPLILLDSVFILGCDGPAISTSKYCNQKKFGEWRKMITTRTVSDARIALDTIVARLNIERFCKIFSNEADETKRHTLGRLIAEEKAKLFALVASPAIQ